MAERVWALCVRVNETKISKFDVSEFYELNIDTKEAWVLEASSGFDKKKKYGRIQKDDILIYNILAFTDDSKRASDMLENPRAFRLRVGKRMSLAESKLKWKDFKLVQERKDAKHAIDKPIIDTAKKSSAASVIQKFKTGASKSCASGSTNSSSKIKSKPTNAERDNKVHAKEVRETLGSDMGADGYSKMSAESAIDTVTAHQENGTYADNCTETLPSSVGVVLEMSDESAFGPVTGQQENATNADNYTEKLPSSGRVVLEELINRIETLQCEKARLQAANEHMSREMEAVQQNYLLLLTAKEDMEKEYLHKILVATEHLKHDRKNSKNDVFRDFKCLINELSDLTGSQVKPTDDSKIYMGDNCYLDKAAAISIHKNEEHFITRVEGLLKNMYPSDYHMRSLSGPDSNNPNFIKIDKLNVKSIQAILNVMSWDESELSKITNACVSKRKKGAGKRRKVDSDEEASEDDISDPAAVRVTESMVRYGIRKATYKARHLKGVKLFKKFKENDPTATQTVEGTEVPQHTQALHTEEETGNRSTSRNKEGGSQEVLASTSEDVTDVTDNGVHSLDMSVEIDESD